MARIRSTHPGQWTDEAFVSCSPLARLLAIAIRNEADDQGVFEWKPLMLKMRLLPADDCNVAELLAELEATNQVTRYEVAGKAYGLIRNFTKFQRPKKPNAVHPLPEEFATSTVQVPNQSATPSENSPQMKEEGGRMEEVRKEEFRFAGRIVRLNARDHETWRRAFSAIPDLDAELTRIDAALSAAPAKNWFTACSAMLAAKHQKLTAARSPPRKTGVMQAIDNLEREYVG